jgi:DNA-binding MarR family transcriptional regulator
MPLPLKDQLCFTLYATSLAVTRSYKPMLDRLRLTYPQYLVLTVLGEEDGLSVGAVASRLDLESSTVTPLIKRMEEAGLLTRHRTPEDERMVRVHLTEQGRRLLAESNCLNESLLHNSGLGMTEIGGLNRQLQELRRTLAEAGLSPAHAQAKAKD